MALSGAKYNASLRVLGNIFSHESAWQQPVIAIHTDPSLDPGASPANGDRYILSDTGALNANFGTITGVGNNDLVEFDGTDFVVIHDVSVVGEGATVWNKDDNTQYNYNGTAWATVDLSSKQDTSEKVQGDGYASLDANAKIPSAQLPAIAITDVFSVADITARDALTVGTGDGEVQEGDVALVTDASADANITSGAASYIYNGSGWSLLKAGDEVLSVNGDTGVITVNAINQLSGDITTSAASGSQSLAATIADDAVTAAKIVTDAVGADALNYSDAKLRSGALSDPFTASLTRTFTHNWATTDVAVEIFDSVTGETCFVDNIVRTSNAVAITLNQEPENSLRILLRELDGSQTTITVS